MTTLRSANRFKPSFGPLLVLCLVASATAQTPPKRPPTLPNGFPFKIPGVSTPPAGAARAPQERGIQRYPSPPRWQGLDRYDERRSRAAFSACDRDGDDRLNVREARACLTGMGDADDPAGFRTLDTNRNGFLHWSEFDARYREATRRGGTFRFRPARPFTDPFGAKRPDTKVVPREQRAAEFVVAMANLDDDPDISRQEFSGLLQALGQPATMNHSFGAMDLDRSGGLSKAEFLPILSAVPYLTQLVLAQSGTPDPSMLQPGDLERRLTRLHPALQRWSRAVFRAADRNGDGVLAPKELVTTPPPTKPAAPANSPGTKKGR